MGKLNQFFFKILFQLFIYHVGLEERSLHIYKYHYTPISMARILNINFEIVSLSKVGQRVHMEQHKARNESQ